MRDAPNEHGHLFNHPNHASGGMDQVFADFVTDPTEDTGSRNDAVEHVEDGRHEDDEGETGRFIDDYLNQA